MDNAARTVPDTQYEVGTNVTYTCDECYEGGGISTCQCDGEWTPVPECRKCKYGQCTSPWSHMGSCEPQRAIEIFRSDPDTDTRIWIDLHAIYLSLVSIDTGNLLIPSVQPGNAVWIVNIQQTIQYPARVQQVSHKR